MTFSKTAEILKSLKQQYGVDLSRQIRAFPDPRPIWDRKTITGFMQYSGNIAVLTPSAMYVIKGIKDCDPNHVLWRSLEGGLKMESDE